MERSGATDGVRRTLPADLTAYRSTRTSTEEIRSCGIRWGSGALWGKILGGTPGERLCPRTSMVLTLLQTLWQTLLQTLLQTLAEDA